MAIEHDSIPDADIHEPKGASSASAGDVYVADGTGSGTWATADALGSGAAPAGQVLVADGSGGIDWKYNPLGWGYYQHSGAGQVVGTTATKLTINGSGVLTNESYLPPEILGSGSLWDTTASIITPISLGDSYDIRIDLPITAETATPTELTLQFDIGGDVTPTFVILSRYIGTGRTTPYTMSVGFPLLALSSTTVSNGIQIFGYTDAGSVTITNPSITIVRNVSRTF